ncbi:Imm7 family immunity protein [uncultured Aquimarina sp.]|uniref:Imm7 family immunity protein n=1 Tax=uncultured Aquimarina sp. TaxID=575652 RepID=UPI002614F223|nr:Imm7 family immunity protein [uncultured Aquimarina sp.]
MIDINGWICIRESFKEEGEDESKLNSIVRIVESKISKELDFGNEFYEIKRVNGSIYLNITIAHNHRSEHPFEFFKWLASTAVGSYGLIYVMDDEDIERGNENKFKVLRIRKGQIDELDDPFLSPINPEIEE